MGEKIINNSYGSIPHLSSSKMGQQADKKISFGQEQILTKKVRDWKDLIIVTEKIDGSNVGIVKKDGTCRAVTRAGYDAESSPHRQHHFFKKYMFNNIDKFTWLAEGWRICGEWCIQAHGTMMDITGYSPFVAFDIFDDDNKRVPYLTFELLCFKYEIATVPLLHIGQPISIKNAIKLMDKGHYGKPEKPEGCVWRCERKGEIEFLAKWVHPEKEDGKYMKDEIFNKGYEKPDY